MATTNLGRVVPLYKGNYSGSTQYEINDIVKYTTKIYWHFGTTATTGVLPTDTSVWAVCVQDGKGVTNISVSKLSTVGLVDTYRMAITYSDGTSANYDYVVTNGNGIASIAKTATVGLYDTYTITYTDGTTDTYDVINGDGITAVTTTLYSTSGNVDTYQMVITLASGSSTYSYFTVTNASDSVEVVGNQLVASASTAETVELNPTLAGTEPVLTGIKVGDTACKIPSSEKFTSITASSWVSSVAYADYAYECSIALTGVTSSDLCTVVFDVTDATSGNYAPVCTTYNGGVTIYGKVNTSITIPAIVKY